jgi:predicted PurR-regulated permease PerM
MHEAIREQNRGINQKMEAVRGKGQGMKARSISFYVILGTVLFAFIQSFSLLSPILLSFLIVLLISLAINPVIFRMRVLTGGRKVATGMIIGGFIAVIVLTGWSLFEPMKDSVTNLSKQLPEYWERLQKPLIRMEQQAVLSEKRLQAEVTTEIGQTETALGKPKTVQKAVEPTPLKLPENSGSLRSSLSGMLQGVVGSFTAVAFNGAQILVVLVTVFFGVTFTLMNPRPILRAMFSLLPERHHGQTLIIMQRIRKFVPAWAGATLLGMLTIGLLVFLIMWPIFGLMDALVLGLIAGVMEAVPFLGPILSAVPALLLALGTGGMTPLWVLLAYIVIQALENNVILPFIMARGMKLHPVAVLFSMLLCVLAFGVLGVLVAAPLVAIVGILHDELYRKRFLPTVTDADLDRMAGEALLEEPSVCNRYASPNPSTMRKPI